MNRSLQTALRGGALAAILAVAVAGTASAQTVIQARGVDSRVDYESLKKVGPWDDRNYQLTAKDVAMLAANEDELDGAVPAWYRVEVRKSLPDLQREGVARYPRSMFNVYTMRHGGYLIDGKLYQKAERQNGTFKVMLENGYSHKTYLESGWGEMDKFLNGDVRVTSPTGAAESAIKINHTDDDLVIAGSNGPGGGQKMHYSTDGGDSWTQAAALPQGNTCCDPTVDWSFDGTKAYAAALAECGSVCDITFYRSADGGQTWNDLSGGGRRRLTNDQNNDKEFLHVDKFATSPHRDNLYLTWHKGNVMQFGRSTDFGDTWAIQAFSSATDQRGIGSDITTDKSGNVYYIWPAFNSQRILVRKSTNGGSSFGSVVEVASTNASFDFPIPSIETRAAFIYVSADTDFSNGPYADSIYAAWLDTSGPESSNPANNHSRIQVAYSRDGGSTWSLSTPHETADINSVDRWNPWLAVGPDGQVHVIFYDTRRDPSRSGVDVFYSSSADGAQTWTSPIRVTSEFSPNIGDGFEFGDYNGADIVLNDVIGIFTDNRNEGGGSADSVDVYAVGIPVTGGGGGGGGGNTAPTVAISAPANGSSSTQGTSVTFTGSATDAEDGTISASLSWSSSLDGNIGSGASFGTSTLSVGNHTITASVTDSGGLSDSDSISITVNPSGGGGGPQDAVYDASLGAPKCATVGSECDSLALLDSRGTLSPAEPNRSNTLDGCTDGNSGTYHSDESNDRLVVKTLDNTDFAAGKTVQVDATVWGWSTGTSDHLDLYYAADANSPSWTLIQTIDLTSGGAQTLSAQYTLPAGSMQAVRANFRYNGSANPCTSGNYNDHDDLVFAVSGGGGGGGGGGGTCAVDEDFSGGLSGWTTSGNCSTGTFVADTPTQIVNSGVTTQLAGDHTSGTGNALFTATNTSAGVNDVDGGTCTATSPAVTVSDASDLSVWFFHGQRDAGDDANDGFLLEYSTNGGSSWTTLQSYGDVQTQAAWTEATASIAAGSNFRLRVSATDGSGPGDLVEAGIDDVSVCPTP